MYAWKAGSRAKVSAEVAGKVCEELEKEGGLTASRLVDASRPEDAPLHGEFEWHDHIAAEEYRKEQAREIMRHLIIVQPEDETKETVRAFFNVSVVDPQYYSTAVIIKDEDKYEQLKKRAISELEAIHNRYSMIMGIEAIYEAIQKIREAS